MFQKKKKVPSVLGKEKLHLGTLGVRGSEILTHFHVLSKESFGPALVAVWLKRDQFDFCRYATSSIIKSIRNMPTSISKEKKKGSLE